MKLRILELNKHNHYGNMVSKPEGDAGIDLYFPNDINVPARQSLLIDFEIQCEMWTWTKDDLQFEPEVSLSSGQYNFWAPVPKTWALGVNLSF